MLRYHERAEDLIGGLRATRHVQGVRRPPTEGVRNWRTAVAPHDLQLFEALAGDLLDQLGYERSGLPVTGRVKVEAHAIRLAHRIDRGTYTFRTRVARKLHRGAPVSGRS